MTATRNTLVVVGIGVAIVAAATTLSNPAATRRDTTTAKEDVGMRTVTSAFVRSAVPTGCVFARGTHLAYEVETTTDVEVDFSTLSDDVKLGNTPSASLSTTPPKSVKTERGWHIEFEAVDADLLAASIEDRGVTVSRGEAQAPSAALSETFLVRVAPDCSILEFGWRSAGDLDAAYEQQLLTSTLGFSVSVEGDDTWVGRNMDASGRFDVSYVHERSGAIVGTIISGLPHQSAVPGMLPMALDPLRSRIAVQPRPGGWFETLSSERELELIMGDTAVGHHARATLANAVEPGRWRAKVDLDDGGWSWGSLLGRTRANEAKKFSPDLVGVPLANALDIYRQMIEANENVGVYGTFLQQWLRANPDGTDELLGQLRAGAFDDEQLARGGVFFALGTAHTPEATAGLVDLVGSSGERPANIISAAQALHMVDKPTVAMVELIEQRAGDSSLSALESGSVALALGTLADTSADADPEVASAATKVIDGWLQQPQDDEQLRHSLLAAGNAGSEALTDSIVPYLEHDDAKVRGTAIHALRQLPPEQVFPHVEDSLLDEDSGVRQRALETALAVSKRHKQAPNDALVELAAEQLGGASLAEEGAIVRLLGVAAGYGNAHASELLDAHVRTALDAETRDYKRIAALGAVSQRHWQAD